METNKAPGSMTRAEHIREETRLAEEFGQAPRKPVSVARNFRTEGLTRLTPPPFVTRGEVLEVMRVAPPAAPRAGNEFVDLGRSGALLANIEDILKRLTEDNRALLTPTLLDLYGNYAAQAQDAAQLKALQQRVLSAAFGDQYFTQMRGGSAVDHPANGEQPRKDPQ
jgi:hypothetical protein